MSSAWLLQLRRGKIMMQTVEFIFTACKEFTVPSNNKSLELYCVEVNFHLQAFRNDELFHSNMLLYRNRLFALENAMVIKP